MSGHRKFKELEKRMSPESRARSAAKSAALTKDVNKTIQERAKRDPAFREALAREVFEDIGFTRAEATVLTHKSELIDAIRETMERRELTQKQAADICHTDQPTISKVLRGRMESVTIDQLSTWLMRCRYGACRE